MKGKENASDNELDLSKLIASCDDLEQEFVRLRLIEDVAKQFALMLIDLAQNGMVNINHNHTIIAQDLLDALNLDLNGKEKQL